MSNYSQTEHKWMRNTTNNLDQMQCLSEFKRIQPHQQLDGLQEIKGQMYNLCSSHTKTMVTVLVLEGESYA